MMLDSHHLKIILGALAGSAVIMLVLMWINSCGDKKI